MSSTIIGMYVHQHWAYNHPYCARTWTLDDWRGYTKSLSRLGYNTVLIWPMLETLPDPLTESDQANLDKIAQVIDMLHDDFAMKAYIVVCPNVAPKHEEARKYTFQDRPFFHTTELVDPGDPVVFGKLMAWREQIIRPLAQANGVLIIDSDPGGWPNSTNLEYVYLLGAHRRLLDRLRPGMELYYWVAMGWEGYCRFHATGELQQSTMEEIRDCIALLSKQRMEPWGLASMRGADLADALGFHDRVFTFNYGAIEGEPSFPLTRFDDKFAYEGGGKVGARGVMGNAQTHCVQLPNTFAFARGAQGLSCDESDYVRFADDLIPTQGRLIVEAWRALQGSDPGPMDATAASLSNLPSTSLTAGPLAGLLFGDPPRFVEDLAAQLRASAALWIFHRAVFANPQNPAELFASFERFYEAISAWRARHGYSNHWYWEPMSAALRALNRPALNDTLDTLRWVGEGATPFEAVRNGLVSLETYTPRLLEAMQCVLGEMRYEMEKP